MASIIPKFLRINPITKRHVVKKIVKTCPQHLFSIVTDVDSYKNFLPFCKDSKVLRRSDCGTMFDAALVVGISDIPPLDRLEEEYISRVTQKNAQLEKDGHKEWIVEARSIRSELFDSLSSRWRITEYVDTTNMKEGPANGRLNIFANVEFEVEMSVADPIVIAALDHVLEKVAEQQVVAFERQCEERPRVTTNS
jgi:ribosome-associated toxin RatA of RatAB toxin-antitoxin module